MHTMKDGSNHQIGHELVPIVTMSEQMLPEMLDNLPPTHQALQQLPPPTMHMQQSGIQTCVPNVLTGVYTLTEEPELEIEENTSM